MKQKNRKERRKNSVEMKKLSRYRHAGTKEEKAYSYFSVLTSALDWGRMVSVTPRPRFTPGERTSVPSVQEAGWASKLVWTQRLEEKSFPSGGNRGEDGTIILKWVLHSK
jgi:hypothetical protein